MAVYVDKMRAKYRRMIICHMLADTEEELHEMADRIGVKRRWFQADATLPHYDICLAKKKLALEFGAIEIDRCKVVELIREHRRKKADGNENRNS